jgi:pyruvate dehydrogenase E2 component (dihydrolipoamide acetyltransferase)
MEQGIISSWELSEGQQVNAGDALAMVDTDKATVACESVEDGYLAKILVNSGPDEVAVGVPVAVVCEEEADVSAFANFSLDDSAAAPAAQVESTPEPAAAPAAAPSISYPPHEVLLMPALSPTMEQGTIASWELNEGDEVSPGDALAQVETDKATVAFESVEAGFLAKILVPGGTADVPVNSPVAVVCEEAEDVAAFTNFVLGAAPASEASVPAATASSSSAPVATPTPAAVASSGGRVFASPFARKLAAEQGLDIRLVPGTGPEGRILAADVKEYKPSVSVSAPAPAPVVEAKATPVAVARPTPQPQVSAAAPGDHTDIPLTQMRKVIAQRLTQSKQTTPHFYVTTDINVDKLMKLRAELNTDSDVRFSVNDFLIKASALALKAHPECNSSWMETFIRQNNFVDISVAVATPKGLLTPIIKDTDLKGMSAIANEGRDLYARARDGKLQPDEIIGGTFTISNLGGRGVKEFSAIVNPPQACILAVGGIDHRVVPSGDAEQPFTTAKMLTVTLSCDHRVVDGAVGAQFLQTLKALLETPMKMLL